MSILSTRTVLAGGLIGCVLAIGLAGPASASGLSVAPNPLVFSQHPTAGGSCPGTGCTYASVTISNGTFRTQKLTKASASTPFWVTFGGTCNVVYAYRLPARKSCTLEFGFKPTARGKTYFGKGLIEFVSTAGTTDLSLGLKGSSHT
jgi:hypothetical protein